MADLSEPGADERDVLKNKLAAYRFLLMIAVAMVILLAIALLVSMSTATTERQRVRQAEHAEEEVQQAAAKEAENAAAQLQAKQETLSETETELHRTQARLASHHEAKRRRSMGRHTQQLATRSASGPSWTDDRNRRALKAHKHVAKLIPLGAHHIKQKQYAQAEAVLLKALAELEGSRPIGSDWLATRTRSWRWRILTPLESLYGPDALDRPIRRAVVNELVRRPSLNGSAALAGETTIIPTSELGGRQAALCLVGPPGAFKVANIVGDVSVSPTAGRLPVLLRVSAEGSGLHPFAINTEAGAKTLTATGVLFVAEWDLRFFKGRPDSGPRSDSAARKGLVAGEPLARQKTNSINFTWWGRSPAPGVPADHFGTVATTSVRLNAGTYKIWTSADDGVRVWIDGSRAIDDWAWRPPEESATTVVLESGLHKIRIEHFETTGHAQLNFGMELLQ